jgi:hypothetical protein
MAALDAKVKDLLNKYADTQPALRLPNEPFDSSNIKLGDVIDSAATQYTPATPGDWNGAAPKTVAEALDRLAAVAPANP